VECNTTVCGNCAAIDFSFFFQGTLEYFLKRDLIFYIEDLKIFIFPTAFNFFSIKYYKLYFHYFLKSI